MNMLKFNWSIESFSLLNQDTGEYLFSPHFKIKFMKNMEACIRLYPRGRISPTRITCVLCLSDDTHSLDIGTRVIFSFTNKLFSRTQELVVNENNKSDLRLTIKKDDFEAAKNQLLYEDNIVIECVIQEDISDLTISESCSAKTIVKFEKHSHNLPITTSLITCPSSWTRRLTFLKNILLQRQSGKLKLCIDLGNDSFGTSIPTSSESNSQNNLSVEIERDSFQAMVLQCKLLLYSSENTFYLVRDELFVKEQNGSKKWYFNINENDVTNFSFLCCELRISNGKVLSETETSDSPKPSQALIPYNPACPEYKSILNNMYTNKAFCDVIFQIGKDQFPAHKCVLAAVSSFLAATFLVNMEETKPIIVPITDVDSETFAKVLQYVYKGTVENLEPVELTKLYSASDKYQILNLKNICSSQLMAKLCMDNVCEILEIANLHQDKSLEDYARSLIYSNYKDIYGTNSWKSLMTRQIHLAADVMLQVCLRS